MYREACLFWTEEKVVRDSKFIHELKNSVSGNDTENTIKHNSDVL